MPRKNVIEIANPLPGGQKFTSTRRAEDYVRRGVAYLLRDGRLRFRAHVQSRREAGDAYVDCRGVVWWDGSDPGGMHRPGEVVS